MSGTEAAKIAPGMRAMVRVLDTNPSRLAYLADIFGGRLDLVVPNRARIAAYVAESDVVIGAVLVPGAKAPKLVSREMIARDAAGQRRRRHRHRPGRLLRDQPADHPLGPDLRRGGVVHYCVANIPGAVARTSTLALTSATLPYLMRVADQGVRPPRRPIRRWPRG